MSRVISQAELKQHNNEQSGYWTSINGKVYDVSKFHRLHPGGSKILLAVAGRDSTDEFFELHRQEVLVKYGPKLQIGVIEGWDEDDDIASLSEISQVPYGEHCAWQGFESPYYKETHLQFRTAVRRWIYKEFKQNGLADRYEKSGKKVPDAVFHKMGDAGVLAGRLGPGEHLRIWAEQAKKDPNATIFGVSIGDFDYFHESILHEEMGRVGAGGFVSGCGDGFVIGCPPVVQFGSDAMKAKVLPDVLNGRKRICLAISEPHAGSDVANIKTVAKKTADGKYYLVSGIKKWITGGHHADYFITAVRTGGKGMNGVSVLLLERGMPGLTTKSIKTSYSPSAGTALVICEDVKVPVENLLGMENAGFMCIMYNFNHERWFIVAYILGSTRSVVEETFKWCMQRKAFGARLADQGVVRFKVAQMVAALEPIVHWLDCVTHQMNNMDYSMQAMRLAGTTSLLKYQATRVAHLVADNAVQLFGGRGITKSGMGRFVERFNVGNKFGAILGGSEEIMADLGVKMAMRSYPKQTARL